MEQRILIVDDEAAISWALKMALSEEGYIVVVKNVAQEAIDEFKKAPFDMLITDMRMPDKSGIDVIREVKELSPDVKSMVMTAYPSLDTALDALRLKVDEYIQKPFEVENVKTLIKKIMATKSNVIAEKEVVAPEKEAQKESVKTEKTLRINYLKRFTGGGILKEIDYFDSEDYLESVVKDLEMELKSISSYSKMHAAISAVMEAVIFFLGLKASETSKVSLHYLAKKDEFEATINAIGIDSALLSKSICRLNSVENKENVDCDRELLVVKGLSDKVKFKKSKDNAQIVFKIRNIGQ